MLKSFFLKNRLLFAKNRFFLDYRFWRHSDRWLLEHAGLPWGLMQLSRWVVKRQAYKQTGHADWTDRLLHALARSVTCHGKIQSATESGGGRETAACSKQHRLKRSRWGGERGEPASRQQTICNHTDLPVGLLASQSAARPPLTTQGADREVSTEVRGFTLIISKASNRSVLTAASARVPISRIDNTDTRTRTRICFDNRFFDYRLTCLIWCWCTKKGTK